jgi:nicotinamidase-related amidase
VDFQFVPSDTVKVPEIQYAERITLSVQSVAIIIVDMQNDFVKPEGKLVVPAARNTVPHLRSLLKSARSLGVPIAYTQDTHFDGDPEWEIWPEHCRMGSWGWEIVEELQPDPEDLICQKNRYDGFYGTWLEHVLSRVWQVEHLVIVGTVSNICVAHTAASAGLRWFHIVVPADGISAQTEFDQALTLRQVSALYAGDVVKSVDQIHFDQ